MKGTMLIYPPGLMGAAVKDDPELRSTVIIQECTEVPSNEVIHEAVGGFFESVAYFKTIKWGGKIHACEAFCHGDGKVMEPPLPPNFPATYLWAQAIMRMEERDDVEMLDYLAGPIVVLFGDEEFMDELHAP
jgi:hypothetical protein